MESEAKYKPFAEKYTSSSSEQPVKKGKLEIKCMKEIEQWLFDCGNSN